MQHSHLPARAPQRASRPSYGDEADQDAWGSNAEMIEAMRAQQGPAEEEAGPEDADQLIRALLGNLPDETGPASTPTAAGLTPELPGPASPDLGAAQPAAEVTQAPAVSGAEILDEGPEEAEAEAVAQTVSQAVAQTDPQTHPGAFDAAFEAETGVVPETIPVRTAAPNAEAEGQAQAGEVTVPAPVAAPQTEEQTAILAHELAHVALGHTDHTPAARGRNTRAAGLSRGSTGAAVDALQKSLVRLGFMTASDRKSGPGTFGPRTEEALKRFQLAEGVEVTGVYGDRSSAAMSAALARRTDTTAKIAEDSDTFADTIPRPTLRSGDEGKGVVQLQEALIRLGHLGADVRTSGRGLFGPRTEAAVAAFQRAQGIDPVGSFGPRTWTALKAALGLGATKPPSTPAPTPAPTSTTSSKLATWDKTAPTADYRRMWFRGVQINRRTKALIDRAEWIMQNELGYPGFSFSFSQGSYNTGVSASAGTHDGGGALDIRDSGLGTKKVDAMVKALRMAGFAAWSRGRGHDSFDPHIHAIAIGDKEVAWLAGQQQKAYANGRNGLSNNARDPDAKLGRPMPAWAKKILK